MALFRGRKLPRGVKVLRATQPSAGIEDRYRRELNRMIKEMHDSVVYWIEAAYKSNEPRIAQDEPPAQILKVAMARLVGRWQDRFDEAAKRLADYFAKDVEKRSMSELKRILKKGGWAVEFKMTPAMRDVFAATVNQNVALIKSIPQQYLSDVEGMVQRSVQSGRDLKQLSDDLSKRYDITRRRAELIARDQNNKATSAFTRARRVELGLFDAVWMHSHAGREPRPTHVAMNGKEFDIRKGMWDPAEQEWIQPGELINCRCSSRPLVRGFE